MVPFERLILVRARFRFERTNTRKHDRWRDSRNAHGSRITRDTAVPFYCDSPLAYLSSSRAKYERMPSIIMQPPLPIVMLIRAPG